MTNINIRDLSRNMKSITEKVLAGESFTVYKNSKPVFNINPIPEDINANEKANVESLAKRFEDLIVKDRKDLKNISNEIDEILYGS